MVFLKEQVMVFLKEQVVELVVVVGENTTQKLHVHRLGHMDPPQGSPNTLPNHF
jgi:hypothetical protein|tara:strand:+ start:244 stop:405 length:162 start_codon:yes stop_codon:yes gene_type:complete